MSDKLPSHLHGTYTRYKDDTEYCIRFLVTAAKKSGYDIQQLKKLDLKSDALVLTTRELVDLASAVARRWPNITITSSFVRCLKDALRARKICSAWFSHTQDPETEASNNSHEHFNQVLQSIADLLVPLHAQQRTAPPKPQRPKVAPNAEDKVSDIDVVGNSFQGLDIQEDTHTAGYNEEDNDLHLPSGLTEPEDFDLRTAPDITITETETSLAETVQFALHSFFLDLHRIRGFTRKIWSKYQAGTCDLGVVSAVTNHAIDIVVRLEHELSMMLNMDCDYDEVFVALARSTPEDDQSPEQWRESLGNLEDYDNIPLEPGDFIFFHEYTVADHIIEMITKRNADIAQTFRTDREGRRTWRARLNVLPTEESHSVPGSPRSADTIPEADEEAGHGGSRTARTKTTHSSKRRWDEFRLMVPAAHASRIESAVRDSMDFHPTPKTSRTANSIVDEALYMVRRAWVSQELKVSTVFAMRMLLDSFEVVVEADRDRPLNDLDTTAKTAQLKAKLHLAYLKSLDIPGLQDDQLFKVFMGSGQATIGSSIRSLPKSSTALASKI